MIQTGDIITVLGQRLMTLDPLLPIAWPNKDLPLDTALPYLIFDIVPVTRTDATLAGGMAINTGFVMVTVVSKLNTSVIDAMELAEDVAALFAYPLRLPVTGGEIVITQPPEVMQGYPDQPHWRTPVKINYSAS